MIQWKFLGLSLVAGLVLWFPATSVAVCVIRHRLNLPFDVMLSAAYYYWIDLGHVPGVLHDLQSAAIIGGVVALIPFGVVLFYPFRETIREARPDEEVPQPKRAFSGTHGRASWMREAELLKAFPGPHPLWGGVVVGEAYRVDKDSGAIESFLADQPSSWGKGGTKPLMVDPCSSGSPHGTVFAGSGGYKTTGVAIPTMVVWTASAVVFDPPGQISEIVEQTRLAMGQQVYKIGPRKQGMNVLSWIDIAHPEAEAHVLEVLNWIGGDISGKAEGENGGFVVSGRDMLACLLADMLWDPELPDSMKTLRELRNRVVMPAKMLKDKLSDIAKESHSVMARKYASSLMELPERTFGGAYFYAAGETNFLTVGIFADTVSNGDCDPSCICTGAATVFVEIEKRHLDVYPALGRLVIAAFQAAMRRADGQLATGRVLFLLDEVKLLKRLEALQALMTYDRKFGATVVTIWQDETEQRAIWKEYASLFTANSGWTMYAAVKDLETLKRVSALAGKQTVITRNQGDSNSTGQHDGNSSRGRNFGLSEQPGDLISQDQVRMMRKDEAIIFQDGAKPIRCGRAIYFRRKDMAFLKPGRFQPTAELEEELA